MKVKVIVTLKNGVLDPQGKAIQQTLNGMTFDNVSEVRQGKYFDILPFLCFIFDGFGILEITFCCKKY